MTKRTSLSFVAVSALCLVTHNIVMIAADYAGFALPISIGLSFAIVVIIGYVGHSLLTFGEPLSIDAIARYGASMVVGSAIGVFILLFWKVGLDLPMIIASPAASACTLAFNFKLSRWAIARTAASGE